MSSNYWICKDCYHSWDSKDRLVPLQCPNTTCNSTNLQYDFEAELSEAKAKYSRQLDRMFKARANRDKEYDKYQYNEFSNRGKHNEE